MGQIRNRKEIAAGPRRPDASIIRGTTEAGGGVEGGAIFGMRYPPNLHIYRNSLKIIPGKYLFFGSMHVCTVVDLELWNAYITL